MAGQVSWKDEFVDAVLARPIAAGIVAAVVRTSVTPNHLTVVGTLCGVAAGVFLGLREGLPAALAIFAYLVFDCADGQLARRRKSSGPMGLVSEGVGDSLTAVAFHLGLVIGIARVHGWLQGIVLGGAAFLAVAWTSLLFDRFKRRFRDTVCDADDLRPALEGAGPLKRFSVNGTINYITKVNRYNRVADVEAYQARVAPTLPLWRWTGPTTHFTVLAICAALGELRLAALIIALPMSLMSLGMLLWQRRLEYREPPVVVDS
jgi:hypothetical protein